MIEFVSLSLLIPWLPQCGCFTWAFACPLGHTTWHCKCPSKLARTMPLRGQILMITIFLQILAVLLTHIPLISLPSAVSQLTVANSLVVYSSIHACNKTWAPSIMLTNITVRPEPPALLQSDAPLLMPLKALEPELEMAQLVAITLVATLWTKFPDAC